jgi:hypothetical protein
LPLSPPDGKHGIPQGPDRAVGAGAGLLEHDRLAKRSSGATAMARAIAPLFPQFLLSATLDVLPLEDTLT